MELDRRDLLRWLTGSALVGGITPFLTACGGDSTNCWPVVSFPAGIHYGPYVVHPTTDGITILWRSTEPVRGSVDCVGEDGELPRHVRELSSGLDHEVHIRGLRPGTRYYYRILHGGRQVGGSHRFDTISDDPNAPVVFAVVGDSGSGCPAQFEVATVIDWVMHPQLILHVGDVVYSRATPDRMRARHFWPFARLIDHVPLYPAWGNHDVRPRWYELIKRALRAPDYYAFRRSSCLFVCLNSVLPIGDGSEQLRWLERELSTSKARWKFVSVHHPPYASRRVATPDQSALVELIDAHRVDMVFSGDAHFYERTVPIRDGRRSDEGAVYVTTGGGGGALYPILEQPLRAVGESVHHAIRVEVDGDTLDFRAIRHDGTELDSLRILKTD